MKWSVTQFVQLLCYCLFHINRVNFTYAKMKYYDKNIMVLFNCDVLLAMRSVAAIMLNIEVKSRTTVMIKTLNVFLQVQYHR